MTAMTERAAKAAVREFIDANGHPITNGSTYGRLYNATHAWAHSPDGPNAPNAANMENTLRFYRLQSLERTKRRGFGNGFDSLQWEWRKTDCRRDREEIMDAVVDALTQEGIPAWPGDATSCVEQIVRVQYDRAEVAEKALAEFKARVKAAIENFCVEYWDDKDWRGRFFPGSYMQKHFAPILAECEQPEPPKPKFAVGQVVRMSCGWAKIQSFDAATSTYQVEYSGGGSGYQREIALRPLTSEEKG